MSYFDDMTVFNNISIFGELSQMLGFNDSIQMYGLNELTAISFIIIWYSITLTIIILNNLFSNLNNNKKKNNKKITLDEYITKRLSEKGCYNLRSKSIKRITDEWLKMN